MNPSIQAFIHIDPIHNVSLQGTIKSAIEGIHTPKQQSNNYNLQY